MAASRAMTTVLDTATSTCTPETVQRKHVFDIRGYSQHKLLGPNTYISSGSFAVGGYDWNIRYFPGGYLKPKYVSVYLELLTASARVRASCDLSIVNQRTGVASLVSRTPPMVFSSDLTRFAPSTAKFKKRSKLEASGFVQGDRLVIECVVTVFMYPTVVRTTPEVEPPSDLHRDLAKLYESKAGADVGFVVRGQQGFSAHLTVLAMRSPVFMAHLRNERMGFSGCFTINHMQPEVFEALLYYIYMDSLPAMPDMDADRKREITMDLLAAADRFAIQRLKLICESALSKTLEANTVVTTLTLAEKHHCQKLREACLEFIASSVDQMK
jgi:speckle-type POZ protein